MFYAWKLNFVYILSHFFVKVNATIDKVVSKLFSWRPSNTDGYTLAQLSFSININTEATLGHWYAIDISISMLIQPFFVNVDTTSINIHRLNFHFPPNFNIETTSNRRNSISLVSKLFCQRWNNVDKCTSAQLSFLSKYRSWSNVDECWRSVLFQHWFNVDVFVVQFPWIGIVTENSKRSILSVNCKILNRLNFW